jgi:type I restriction enzyme S subunit
MKLATFFEKFDEFAHAPDAVVKMRELVLELAVQGKLSEQHAEDSEAKEWRELVSQLDTNADATASESERPFSIPSSWRWTTLETLGDTKPRNDAPDTARSSFVPMTLIPAEYGQSAKHEVRPWGEIKKGYTHFKNGDVVMAKITPCFENGKSAVMNGLTGDFGAGTTELHVFRGNGAGVLPEFVIIYLKTRGFIMRGIPRMTGSAGQKRVPSDYFTRSPIPLPPLAEQKRIVAKVDELMALCDRLEAQQQERETRHAALALASLARFADAPTPANLQFLFHPSYPIPPANLRKSILTLAVQGKLVPQDPNDEPALALLDRIAGHKASLAKEGKLRGSTAVTPMAADEGDLELPPTWTWVRFGDIMVNRDGERIPVSKEERETKAKTYDYYGASGVIDKIDGYLFDKPLLLIGEDGANLINRSTPIAFIARGKYWVNNHAHVLDGISEDFLQFIELHINAINLERYVTGSAQPKMNQAKMNSIPIALPPLAEQRRIVAKVDQLMALLDELETQLAASRATAANLLSALVAELTSKLNLSNPKVQKKAA